MSAFGQKRTFNYYLKTQTGLKIAPKTLTNFLERIARLYTPTWHEGRGQISHEQGAESTRIGQYVRNWYRWATAGVDVTKDDVNQESKK
jgi:hypothetical protein